HRFALLDRIGGQLVDAPVPALGIDAGDELFADFSAIEAIEALAGEQLQRARQVGLAEYVAFRRRRAAGEEHLARAGVALHDVPPLLVTAGKASVDREAVARDADRRRQRGRQRQLPVLFREVHERRRETRNPRRPGAIDGTVAIEPAIGLEVALLTGGGR